MVRPAALVTVLSALATSVLAWPLAGRGDDTSTYIVSLKRGLSDSEVESHFDFANSIHLESLNRRGLSPDQSQATGIVRRHHIHEHRSYIGVFDKATRDTVEEHPAVALVELDRIIGIDRPIFNDTEDMNYEDRAADGFTAMGDTFLQSDAPWGLISISLDWTTGTPNSASSYRFYKDGQGKGVTVYVVDTGVRTTHGDFGGRATLGANFIEGEAHVDYVGHGTHVAGTVGGKTFGVAKEVNIVSVKVLDKNGDGTLSSFIGAADWILDHAKKNGGVKKAIVNYSVGSQKEAQAGQALSDAILNMQKAGIPMIVAAGNEGKNAEKYAPGHMKEVFTVGSTGKTLWRAKTSNYGKVIDIWGPGEDIKSCSHKSDKGTTMLSGTSMATPHVAGLAATYKTHFGSAVDSVEKLFDALRRNAVRDGIKDGKDSPNLFIANGLKVVGRPVNPGGGGGGPKRPPM